MKNTGTGNNIYLHYGCGFDAPSEWLNFDASPILFFRENWFLNLVAIKILRRKDVFPKNVKYGNILKGFPAYTGKCRAVYCSHVLEHLTLEEFRQALRNTYDLLQPGGRFRVVVPCLETLAKTYLAELENGDPRAAERFCRNSYMGREKHGSLFRETMKIGYFKNYHFWNWDFPSLKNELEAAGFKEVRRAFFGDSTEEKFRLVENSDRFQNSVAVECIK